MQINRIQPKQQITAGNTSKKNTLGFKGGREVLRTFSTNPLISTLSLEIPCDIGRGVNAYKRGGVPECRERVFDDVISAFFWMKGVDIFNTFGNKIGKHILKLPETEFDAGKDALRDPLANLVKDQAELNNLSKPAEEKLASKLAAFKFTKILGSAALTVGFMGFILPKINQKITEEMYKFSHGKKEKQQKDTLKNSVKTNFENKDILSSENIFNSVRPLSFEEFDKKTSGTKSASFKGTEFTSAAYMLENNPLCKMLVSDAGMMSGRYLTARNKDEGREYVIRDGASAFFYYASVPLIYKGFETASKSSALTTIDAVSAKTIHETVLKQVQASGGKMAAEEFKEKTLGALSGQSKEILNQIPFKDEVISLAELKNYLPKELAAKAEKISKLQPEKALEGSVLTKRQVCDVFKEGSLNEPEFLQKVYTDRFGKALTDKYRYIPMKKINAFRDNIDLYTQKIIETANKQNGGIVDEKLLKKINGKSFGLSALYRTIAVTVSALALGIAIPKLQYAITEKRTGSKEAPGLREYNKQA